MREHTTDGRVSGFRRADVLALCGVAVGRDEPDERALVGGGPLPHPSILLVGLRAPLWFLR